ncbi:hypothetical protein ANAPC5_01517 [Anaplasma phagocytophilum]|nr:hypothetical protein ANAPC5_01517 [Anaplasma phagocytophilum]
MVQQRNANTSCIEEEDISGGFREVPRSASPVAAMHTCRAMEVQSATLLVRTRDRRFFHFFSLKPKDVIKVIIATERAHSGLYCRR